MKFLLPFIIVFALFSCKSEIENTSVKNDKLDLPFKLTTIEHASFIMEWASEVVYVDPSGDASKFKNLPKPTLVLITDIHGDHFNLETLKALPKGFDLVAPRAVYEELPQDFKNNTKILNNGDIINFHEFELTAVPMYNITKERLNFHNKGRGNGYVVSYNNYRVYISGDTEDIPEMRNLEDIDLAFICMNLPYTMTPEAAADATLSFEPKQVIPYHYRGLKDGQPHYYDYKKFKEIVNVENESIEVITLDWY